MSAGPPPPTRPSSSLPELPSDAEVEIAVRPRQAWRRPLFLAVTAAWVLAVIVAARDVMLPLVLGALIAYVLMPLVGWVERRRVPRGLAILLVYILVLGSLGVFVRLVAPRVGSEIAGFAKEVPGLMSKAKEEWLPRAQAKLRELTGSADIGAEAAPAPPAERSAIAVKPGEGGAFEIDVEEGLAVRKTRDGFVVERRHAPVQPFDADRALMESIQSSVDYARQNAFEVARIGGGIVAAVSRFFFVFGLTLMVGAYLMLTKERTLTFFTMLLRPSSRRSFIALVDRVDRGLAGVVRGQIVICLINGALSALGFIIVGLKYWPILAIIATLFSLVPIFGSIASAIPAVALGLTQSFGTGIFVLVWIIAIHQMEANVLNPKILGDAAKIHPVLVIVSLLIGEHLFKTTGALLAVPCMSIAQSIFIHFRAIVQADDPELAREPVTSSPPAPPKLG